MSNVCNIVVKEINNKIVVTKDISQQLTFDKLEACKVMHEIKNILKIDEMLEGEQEELTPCDFFESACQQMIGVDPAEEQFEFEFYQELLNAYKNYRVKHELSPFSSDEMPSK